MSLNADQAFQKLTIHKFERNILMGPLYHQLFAHTQRYHALAGMGLLSFGLALHACVTPSLELTSIICLIVGVAFEAICTMLMFLPCKCGELPLFTAKARLRMMRTSNKRFVMRGAAAGLLIGLVVDSLGLQVVGIQSMVIIVGWFLLLLGSFFLLLSVNQTVLDWHFRDTIVSRRERDEVGKLTGKTNDELHKLINFHLKSGNFSKADEYSLRLLEQVEHQCCA